MLLKISLASVTLISEFLFTGWILNWAPMDVMLTKEGYYADRCTILRDLPLTVGYTSCDEQQVKISTLWSAVLLSEFTILPCGIFMDYIGPSIFSVFVFCIHVGSLTTTLKMSRSSPLLPITFFFLGMSAQAVALLAMRSVYIFDTDKGKRRWILACCTVFDSSAICTMIFYNLWAVNLITLADMFWILLIVGGALFLLQFLLWVGFNKLKSKSEHLVFVTEKDPLLQNPVTYSDEGEVSMSFSCEEQNLSLTEVFGGYKFYFFVILCAINIYRIRYFLGLAEYSLKALHDKGVYLQLLGYCFALSVFFAPVVDKIICYLDSHWLSLHVVNLSITAFFLTWLIPNLPIQVVTFALFILARLFCFSVLTEYCSNVFTEKRFGLVMGSGFVAASIPGAFTYKIVDVVLRKYNGNFWIFHLMCICLSIPASLLIFAVQHKYKRNRSGSSHLKSSFDNKSMTPSTPGRSSIASIFKPEYYKRMTPSTTRRSSIASISKHEC